MYVCIFNVYNFVNSTVIFMKCGDKSHIISIVMLALTGFSIGLLFVVLC